MTYDDVLVNSAALMNDASQRKYTSVIQLPYLNLALSELQEIFELNNIPVTQKSSDVINVPSGIDEVGFAPDPPILGTPYLPNDLIEINELFESPEGQNDWTRVVKREYLTRSIIPGGTETSYFGVWSWQEQEIKLLAANQNRDLRLDYIKNLFPILDVETMLDDLTVINSATFLQYRTAGLCAEYLAENPTRASSLNGNALLSLDRTLGISTKGKQSIVYRRRPFRAAFKRRGIII